MSHRRAAAVFLLSFGAPLASAGEFETAFQETLREAQRAAVLLQAGAEDRARARNLENQRLYDWLEVPAVAPRGSRGLAVKTFAGLSCSRAERVGRSEPLYACWLPQGTPELRELYEALPPETLSREPESAGRKDFGRLRCERDEAARRHVCLLWP